MNETAFQMATSNIRFGPGTTREIGMDLEELGVKRSLVLTDPIMRNLPPVHTVLESLSKENIAYDLYDRVSIEPTEESFREAIATACSKPYDGFVAVGGGSTIDTAKAANLYATYPPNGFLDYVNAPSDEGCQCPAHPNL